MMQGVNMMSVVLHNTAHELVSKVNKLELYKVLKNRYGRGILFWTYLDIFNKLC